MTIRKAIKGKNTKELINYIEIKRDADNKKYLYLSIRDDHEYVVDLVYINEVYYVFLQCIDNKEIQIHMKVMVTDIDKIKRLCKMAYWWRYGTVIHE